MRFVFVLTLLKFATVLYIGLTYQGKLFLMKRSVTVMTAFHSQSPFLSKLYILAKCRNEFVIVKLYSINRRKVSVIFLVIV